MLSLQKPGVGPNIVLPTYPLPMHSAFLVHSTFFFFSISSSRKGGLCHYSETHFYLIYWAVFPLLLSVIWWRLSPSYDFGRWGGVLWGIFLIFRILLTNHVYKYAHTRWGGRWMWDQRDPVATEPQHPVSRKEPCHHVSHARRLLDCDQHPSGQSAHCYVQVIMITVMFTWLWPAFLWSICSLLCSGKYNSNVYLTMTNILPVSLLISMFS